jgi:hypothetical protein
MSLVVVISPKNSFFMFTYIKNTPRDFRLKNNLNPDDS